MSTFVETNPHIPIEDSLLNPHYSDSRFVRGSQTVFLNPNSMLKDGPGIQIVAGAHYVISESLTLQYGVTNCAQAEKIAEAMCQKESKNAAIFIQEYLRALLGNPTLVLVQIITGVNRGNGNSYRVYAYMVAEAN